MNTRLSIAVLLFVALVAVVVCDLRMRHALAATNGERDALAERLATFGREERARAQQLAAIRARRDALRKSTATHPAAATPDAEATGNLEGSNLRTLTIANNEDLRTLRVRAFVGEQRLKFAGILHQLRLTPEQLQRFDEIEAEYQQAALDLASSAKAQGITSPKDLAPLRHEIAATHDAHVQELFGDNYATWQEAWRNQGAQATVDELLQQTFQSSGPVDTAQAQALVAIVKSHAQPRTSTGYDWDAIGADAATVLSGPKLEALRTALNGRTLAEKMADASKGRR